MCYRRSASAFANHESRFVIRKMFCASSVMRKCSGSGSGIQLIVCNHMVVKERRYTTILVFARDLREMVPAAGLAPAPAR